MLKDYTKSDARRDLALRVLTTVGKIQTFRCALVREKQAVERTLRETLVARTLTDPEVQELKGWLEGIDAVAETIDGAEWPKGAIG